MLDLKGSSIVPEEREILCHPAVGGVILFSRNYESPEQLAELVARIHSLRVPHLLVAVDHEGGRVQRFREGFTRLPAAARYGRIYGQDRRRARELAQAGGWLMAAELRAVGVDFSFAPVLDLHRGVSRVIDDRAFHSHPEAVADLARAFMKGMQQAGMAGVGKHFPGHGSVEADSHLALPVDPRPATDIQGEDMLAFERLIHYGLPAVMPAHVVYPAVDSRPAGFSGIWLRTILRDQLGFQGAVFSDDLSMAGAAAAGAPLDRAHIALAAGCDMALVCNDPAGAAQVVQGLESYENPVAQARLARMHGRGGGDRAALREQERWRQAVDAIGPLEAEPELDLGDDSLT